MISVFKKKPSDFNSSVEVSASYVEHNGRFLLMKRSTHKPFGNTWGVPCGKAEAGETSIQTAKRELFEETSISSNNLEALGPLYLRSDTIDYVYHMHKIVLDEKPDLKIHHDEHTEARWVTIDEALKLPLIPGGEEALLVYKILTSVNSEFYFIRHGETVWTKEQLISNEMNISMSQKGREQALEVRSVISKLPIKNVCHSPLIRAVETKDLATSDLNLIHHEVCELSECTSQVWNHLMEHEENPGKIPNADTRKFFIQTLVGIFQSLEHEGPSLIVAHGGIHWAFCHLLGIEKHDKKISHCIPVHFERLNNKKWEAKLLINKK